MLEELSKARQGRSRRQSSWDRTGRNRDCLTIPPGKTRVIANVKGAGVVRHIWVTIACQAEHYLRKILLRAYWDGADTPSVEVPIGDFFGVGHACVNSYSCAALNMSTHASGPGNAAMNCYFPMPFAKGARFEVVNECETEPIRSFYYYIDYDELDALADDELRFHATWRRECPCDGWVANKPGLQPESVDDSGRAANLTDEGNYLFVQTRGRGHFVGVNLSIHNLCSGWWGEGDDMFMIDGVKWPPDLHGTGSEDYFGHAWGMQPQNAFIYNGVSHHQPGMYRAYNERITVYRYHLADPVVFTKSLRASIEHGHANTHSNDYSSTAYWYLDRIQKLPKMPPMPKRLPLPDQTLGPVPLPGPSKTRKDVRRKYAKGLAGPKRTRKRK